MSTRDDEIPWEGRYYEACHTFGRQCADLAKSKPPGNQAGSLGTMINTLMTELWDSGFSQTEIRAAFTAAIDDMPRYAAGEERRS
ncbi:MAG TPA: hypothetical protein VGK90_06965 [Rhizomicrobium sp.]|jgi:hypothetical protein